MKQFSILFVALIAFWYSCNLHSQTNSIATSHSHDGDNDTIYCAPGNSKLDIQKIEQVTGMKGVEKNGEYKITVPQHDLNVVVDGFKIIPPMGLGSWAAFTPCGDTAMLMGDIILTETDLAPVQQEVIKQGLSITAIHNHFVRNRPNIMYMHIDGRGKAGDLALNVKNIFEKIKQVRGKDPMEGKPDSVINTINIPMMDSIIGKKG
jgi:hypothetical protein